ncbi:hypothetical protein CPB86DRAFT_775810 [Serendipita vermifera]|nr:hypothetical protein CPB86DRAFT_775810 [Serendipita vermifera]
MRLVTKRSPLFTIKLYRQNTSTGYQSASEKLFADAEIEENDTELRTMKEKLEQRLMQEQNWNGDENIQDAVLRMLVDKHKPLRSGPIRTADEKLKANPPKVSGAPAIDYEGQSIPVKGESDGAMEEHKPWMTTYKTPSFAVHPSIRAMRVSPQSASKRSQLDEVTPVKGPTREERLRLAQANRLASARDNMIDYRYGGIKGTTTTTTTPEGPRTNPKTMKGWKSLVEERIESARVTGAFNNLSGAGKPLERDMAESNPFISREEILLNNMVRRNGAAPPWVELQNDLDASLREFREILQSAWVRRAARNLHLSNAHDPMFVTRQTAGGLSLMRDPEWEEKEKSYHEHAIAELNTLVRRYNGIAPYSVRRGLHTREAELARCYETSGERILSELRAGQSQRKASTSSSVHLQARTSIEETPNLWSQFILAMRSIFRA